MTDILPRTHASELAIDRLLAGELAPADAAALRDHAAACARCNTALDAALATRAAFAAAPPLLSLPRRRATRAVWLASGAGVALAAAALLVVTWPRARPADAVRTKGTAIVGFFVAHAGQVRRGAPTETVRAGDRIELATTTTAPMWFAATSSDGTVYSAPVLVAAGRDRALPGAIELDGSPADEVVTAMFCTDPFTIDQVAAPPDGCTTDRFTLKKAP
jgi:hypothetical protein